MKAYWFWPLWLFCCCLFQALPFRERERACMATARNRLRLSRWRSWVKRGNTGFRISLAVGVFSALSCLSDCLQDQKETVINIRFSQPWLAPNRWHVNVLQKIASCTYIYTCTLINTLFPPSEDIQRQDARVKMIYIHCHMQKHTCRQTPGALYCQKWHSLIDRYFKLLLWWKIIIGWLLGYYPIPPMRWKNESSGIESVLTTLESHMLYVSPKSFCNEFQRCLQFGRVLDLYPDIQSL